MEGGTGLHSSGFFSVGQSGQLSAGVGDPAGPWRGRVGADERPRAFQSSGRGGCGFDTCCAGLVSRRRIGRFRATQEGNATLYRVLPSLRSCENCEALRG